MLEYVPVKELQQFLLKHGVVWDGKVVRLKNGESVAEDMTPNDYGYYRNGGLEIRAKGLNVIEEKLLMYVNETQLTIHVPDRDFRPVAVLGNEWMEYLIENHAIEYVPIVRNYANKEMERIESVAKSRRDEINKQIAKLQQDINQIDKQKEKQLNTMRNVLTKLNDKYSSM